jgi:apolipoprotein N-acyltransferase
MLERLSHGVMLLWGWRRTLVVALAGALGGLAQAPLGAFPVMWIGLPVLVWALDGAVETRGEERGGRLARSWPAFRIGWTFGFGWFLAGLWWIGGAFLVDLDVFGWMLPIALAALSIGLGLFHGLAAAIARIGWTEGPGRILSLAAGFFFADWLRGHVLTGFPWGTIGQAFTVNGPMMQIASLLGGYGPSFLAVLVFAAPALLARPGVAERRFVAAVGAIFVAVVGFGFVRLAVIPTESVPGLRFRVVQPAIDQWSKGRPEFKYETMNRFVELSSGPARDRSGAPVAAGLRSGLAGTRPGRLPGITHLIWPESSFPFLLSREPWALATIAELIGDDTLLVTGAIRAEAPSAGEVRPRFYNSVLALGPGAEILAAYDKVHLVPFGEYLPFQDFAESLGLEQLTRQHGGYTPGPGRRSMRLPGTPLFAPLVCYEAVFPGEVVPAGERPRFLLNVTNDAWFGRTPGPWQHLLQVRLRAVEEGLPVVRAANDGVSAAIDPLGRVVAGLGLGSAGSIDFDLPEPIPPTFASRFGEVSGWMLATIAFLWSWRQRRKIVR